MNLPSLELLEQSILEDSLHEYVKAAFPAVIEPGTPYCDNWHIEAICEHLEAASRGEIKRLIINIPPRHMKSILTSVAWPTWDWIHKPNRKWIFASYSQDLALRDAVKSRDVLQHEWYQSKWGHVEFKDDQNQKKKYQNTLGGHRFSTSVGGLLTGEGADIIVVDDPINAMDQYSEAERARAIIWWSQSLSTRLNDKKTGVFVVIMQRLHELDLVGHILKNETEEDWNTLILPQEYERNHPTKSVTALGFQDPRTEEGQLLWPEREGLKEISLLKQRLGSYAAAGQLQQRPAPAEGGLIKAAWINTYQELPEVQYYTWTWDTAIKEGEDNDYSVGQLWATCKNGWYLIEQVRAKLAYPDLKRQVQMSYNKQPSRSILIEDKASGQQLVQDFKRIGKLPVKAVIPGGRGQMPSSKIERVNLVAPLFEAGKVFIPESAQWASDYVSELITFPNAAHDDQVDATTQFLSVDQRQRVQDPYSIKIEAMQR